jgi:hypothetical protein
MSTHGEFIREFLKLHGDYVVFNENEFWFQDGAFLENSEWGTSLDPPENTVERLARVKVYLEQKYGLAHAAFNEYKQEIIRSISGVYASSAASDPALDEELVERNLAILQRNVRFWRKKLREVNAKLARTSTGKRQASLDQCEAEVQEHCHKIHSIAKSFKI